MKFELAVKSEIIEDLFLPDFFDRSRQIRKQRLNRHILLISKPLRDLWEKEINQNLYDSYMQWLPQAITSQQSARMITQQEVAEDDVVIELSKNAKYPLVIGDCDSVIIHNNPEIRFCSKSLFSNEKPTTITMDMIKEIESTGGVLKNWFSIFETSIFLEVKENQSADLLAKYLSYFYDDEITIQDRYFTENETNFQKYIQPYIPSGSTLKIIIPTEQGSTHKKRLENKYKTKVVCYKAETIHSGYIETKNFKILMGYRLDTFGSNGKTKRENITIIRK